MKTWRHLILAPLMLGCATSLELKPVEQTSPREQAERIYEALLSRDGRAPLREPGTLAGFADAPLKIVRQLEALAASKRGQERPALVELADVMPSTGLYCKVRFETQPKGLQIKYRPIARSEAAAAHAGWNVLPVGLYEVWAERDGRVASEVKAYEVIRREILIVLVAGGRRSP